MAHVKLRAVGNSPPGHGIHGIRMQTCSNLSWTSHNVNEKGGRENCTGRTRSAAGEGEGEGEGEGRGMSIITVSTFLLSSDASKSPPPLVV